MRAIYVSGIERWVSIKSYVRAVKMAKANPTVQFAQGLTCWWSCTGAEVMSQFRDGMNARINEGIPYCQRGMR